MSLTTLAIIVAILLTNVYIFSIYNKIIRLKNQFLNGYAQIDVQLKRRHDLIPKLVDVAKTYMTYEQEILLKITEQRAKVIALNQQIHAEFIDSVNLQSMAREEGVLSLQLKTLIANVENYPDLKANQTMLQLMEELSTTENRIAFARQFYNDAIMCFNTYTQQIPNMWICKFIKLPSATFLEFEDVKK